MNIEEYKKNVYTNNKSGNWTREKYVHKNFPEIYKHISNLKLALPFPQLVWHYFNDIHNMPKCKNNECDKFVKWNSFKEGYHEFCSVSCTMKSNDTQKKQLDSMLKNHGVTHSSLTKKSIIKRFEKLKTHVYSIIPNQCILNIEENKDITVKCDKCNEIHVINYEALYQRNKFGVSWRNCEVVNTGTSRYELEIEEEISKFYNGVCIKNDRTILDRRKEIDIYYPDKKIGIEYNSFFYHNENYVDRNYHKNKWLDAKNKGIKLIHIYEDDWKLNKQIVISRLKNAFGIVTKKIHARKCNVLKIDNMTAKRFYEMHHIQGHINTNIHYGLYYNNELVSAISFGKLRKSMGSTNLMNGYELYRFCNFRETNVIGAGSKLFNAFIREYSPSTIITYALLEWGNGDFYKHLGFIFDSYTAPSYWYVINKKRQSRFNWRKDRLIKLGYDKNKTEQEIMKMIGYWKIWGVGNAKWKWSSR